MAVVVLALPWNADAHRGHSSLSVVEIDAATGEMTITHRLAAHDVEPALSVIAPDAQQSLDDPEAVAALENYARRAFQLWDAEGRVVVLEHRETRLTGDRVWLVYRGRLPLPARTLSVDSNLLAEAYGDQENQVNVRRSRVTRTAVFRTDDEAQRIDFD